MTDMRVLADKNGRHSDMRVGDQGENSLSNSITQIKNNEHIIGRMFTKIGADQ